MNKKVLIIDDSATLRSQVSLALSPSGFEVLEAVDGIDGVEKISAQPDLAVVICDVNMPRMNGIDMVANIKREPKYAALPVIMLTTEGQPELIARAKAAGAKGWIIKPFKPELLVATIKKLAGA
jgi:two-component system, chemotaxis family, chemotaxis protein CheY